MRLLYKIKRKETQVEMTFNSNLNTNRSFFPFTFNCADEEMAELTKRHFEKLFQEYTEYVAANPLEFIWDSRVSDLKKYLIENWNGRDHEYK